MAQLLCGLMSGLSLGHGGRSVQTRKPFVGSTISATRPHTSARQGQLVIVAAQNSKKRQRTAARNRLYNKARKSAVGSRSRKVLKALENVGTISAEEELKPVQTLINEAYKEIDKAVLRKVLHRNTGARRKSKLARARQKVLISSGLYTPKAAPKKA